MLADYVKTTYICSTQQLHDNSLPLIPTPPLIMAVNIGAAECRPLPSDPPWSVFRIMQSAAVVDKSHFKSALRIQNVNLMSRYHLFSMPSPSAKTFKKYLFKSSEANLLS